MQTKTVEVSSLRDKITSLEATLASLTEEKLHTGVCSHLYRVGLGVPLKISEAQTVYEKILVKS